MPDETLSVVVQLDDRTGETIALEVNEDGCVQAEIARNDDPKEVANVLATAEVDVKNVRDDTAATATADTKKAASSSSGGNS